MADHVGQQVLDAMTTKLLTIPSLGTRVFDDYLTAEEVPAKPALCFYGTSSDSLGRGVESTRRKRWGLLVGLVGYVAGEGLRQKSWDLMQSIERTLEADPTLGLGFVEQCRIIGHRTGDMLSTDPQFGIQGRFDMVAFIRYRYTIGSP